MKRLALAALLAAAAGCSRGDAKGPTFHRDVAPILHKNCAPCHREGESAPFSLIEYRDARKRASQLAEVTRERIMPPWKMDPSLQLFADPRVLSDAEIDMLAAWAKAGAPEGDAADAPPPPRFTEGWQLGQPDLVVKLDRPYVLPADGTDVFRNFVLPIALDAPRYVRAVEIRPGCRAVHHGVLKVDITGACRQLDAADGPPGFDGMDTGAAFLPGGQILGWLPGRQARMEDPDLAWECRPGTDLVLQLHMVPSGKPEPIQPVIGLYFSKDGEKPQREAFVLKLYVPDIEIAAGDADYVLEDSILLPVDVELRAVQPHAHYIGRSLQAFADPPEGTPGGRRRLLDIPDWDFNWQDSYRYAPPLMLAKGTRLTLRYRFDNSSDNPRNPHHPPRPVHWGNRSVDEMCELILQLVPLNHADLLELKTVAMRYSLNKNRQQPNAQVALADALCEQGRLDEAEACYLEALRLNPSVFSAHHNLAAINRERGKLDLAARHYQQEIDLHPGLVASHLGLAQVLEEQGKRKAALRKYEEALQLDPGLRAARKAIARLRSTP